MPPKRRRVERRKREHPKVEQWMALNSLSAGMMKLTQQEQQYIALLKQVADISSHEAAHPEKQWFTPEFDFNQDSIADITGYITQWLKEILEHKAIVERARNDAIDQLRKVDVLDNDALKGAALSLTETETQLAALQTIEHRWAKIVRHVKGEDLELHTQKWLKRWLAQWQKISQTIRQRVTQFQETLKGPLLADVLVGLQESN